jgi:hypothetical protein
VKFVLGILPSRRKAFAIPVAGTELVEESNEFGTTSIGRKPFVASHDLAKGLNAAGT